MSEVRWKIFIYNFNHIFIIYLPNVITIDGNLMKFWQKQFCTVFSETPRMYVDVHAYMCVRLANDSVNVKRKQIS